MMFFDEFSDFRMVFRDFVKKIFFIHINITPKERNKKEETKGEDLFFEERDERKKYDNDLKGKKYEQRGIERGMGERRGMGPERDHTIRFYPINEVKEEEEKESETLS